MRIDVREVVMLDLFDQPLYIGDEVIFADDYELRQKGLEILLYEDGSESYVFEIVEKEI